MFIFDLNKEVVNKVPVFQLRDISFGLIAYCGKANRTMTGLYCSIFCLIIFLFEGLLFKYYKF